MPMKKFIVYPAIDLKDGKVVRLKQGQRDDSKIFDLSPSQAAEKWIDQGAEWLHVVNLDGAFGENSQPNLGALKSILASAIGKVFIQFGGGLRSIDAIREILDLGVDRVILGTAAVEDATLMHQSVERFGAERIVLGIDARDGLVRVAGWEKGTNVTPVDLVLRYIDKGLKNIIYTNVRRDGMGAGVDIASTKALASATGVDVIASGGVGSLEDIRQVKSAGLPGVVVGKALYENKFKLSEAIAC
jgi:phosphoribosylformimino-5-aminoimidazole carboxamide ribotide isomerase